MFNQPTTSQTRSAPTGSPERFAHRTRTVVTLCTQAYGMKYNMQMSEHVRMAAGMEVPLRKNLSLYHFELSEQAMDNWESYSARALDLPILAHARGTVRAGGSANSLGRPFHPNLVHMLAGCGQMPLRTYPPVLTESSLGRSCIAESPNHGVAPVISVEARVNTPPSVTIGLHHAAHHDSRMNGERRTNTFGTIYQLRGSDSCYVIEDGDVILHILRTEGDALVFSGAWGDSMLRLIWDAATQSLSVRPVVGTEKGFTHGACAIGAPLAPPCFVTYLDEGVNSLSLFMPPVELYKILTTNHSTDTCPATCKELLAMMNSAEFPACITDYSFGPEFFKIPSMLQVLKSGKRDHLFSEYNGTRNHSGAANRKRMQKLPASQYIQTRCPNCKAMVPVAPGGRLSSHHHGYPRKADGAEHIGCRNEFLRRQGLLQ